MWQKKTVHMLFDELSALSNPDDNINMTEAGLNLLNYFKIKL